MMTDLHDIDIAVLAGGLGTRMRQTLPGVPKILAPVSGRPFLEYLLDWLAAYRARRVILCLGHLADKVQAYLAAHPRDGMEITVSVEIEPLGTAGGIRHARSQLTSGTVMVMNGDSFVDANLGAFLDAHVVSGAPASLLCAEVEDCSRFGSVAVDERDRIARFEEKGSRGHAPGLINAGVYLFSQGFLDEIDHVSGPSLEYDVFAKQEPFTLHAYAGRFPFIDLGTPESYAAATASMMTTSAHT